MLAIAVHGGAGNWRKEKQAGALEGLRDALVAGRTSLEDGATALDAVCAAVVSLEDNPLFNAGTGACFNSAGEIEFDACVMVGDDLQAGAVANLRRVKNPILVARKVMEETGHVLLGGEGALRFARALGFEDYDPMTPERREAFEEKVRRVQSGEDQWIPWMKEFLEKYPELATGTVGAVALDDQGSLAVATSTGGVTMKLVGRIGDTPIPGAGTYATTYGAVSATGQGELMMRVLTARAVCDRIEGGRSAQEAVDDVIDVMQQTVGGRCGVISVDAQGHIGLAHGTPMMPHGFWKQGDEDVTTALKVEAT